MTNMDKEVAEWLRNEKIKKREEDKAKNEAIKSRYKERKFTATPSGKLKVTIYNSTKKPKSFPVKKNVNNSSNIQITNKDNAIIPKKNINFDSKYSLITGEPEGKSLIDEDGIMIDGLGYVQQVTGNEYGNTVDTRKSKGKTESSPSNDQIEINDAINVDGNVEKIIHEIGDKINEIQLLFEKLKVATHKKLKY